MLKISIIGIHDVSDKWSKLRSDLRAKAASMALNKVAAKGKTELTRAITAEFAISAAEVRSSVNLSPARAKEAAIEARIDIFGSAKKRGRSLNVIHFLEKRITLAEAHRRMKKGTLYAAGQRGRKHPVLGFKFKKTGGGKQIEGVFIGNKGRTVFVRTGDKRLPIKPVQMIGVSQMFSTNKITERVMERIDREMVVEFDRAISLLLRK
jgi:hypothetical protein